MVDQLQPPVPADADLTHYPDMPLEVRRLRDSGIAGIGDAEAFRCAVLLWCIAWHQVPAGSLPDDDTELCRLVGLGRDFRTWRKVKAGALRGWRRFADGRLYHAVVAEKVIQAWNSTCATRWSRECDRIRKENKAREKAKLEPLPLPDRPVPVSSGWPPESKCLSVGKPPGLPPETTNFPPENRLKGREGKGRESMPPTASGADAPSDATADPKPGDVKAAIFGAGLRWLMANTGDAEARCRSFLGTLIRDHGEAKTASVLMAAERTRPVEPRSWMIRNIDGARNGPRPRNHRDEDDDNGTATSRGIAAAIARRYVQPG